MPPASRLTRILNQALPLIIMPGVAYFSCKKSLKAEPIKLPVLQLSVSPFLDTEVKNSKNLTIEAVVPKKERLVTRLIREVAQELDLELRTKSGDWIIILTNPKTAENRFIWGYSFDLNSQAVSKLCDDKTALSEVLAELKIPHIEHKIFLNPMLSGWSPEAGVFPALFKYAELYNNDLVLKSKEGSGGTSVFHCQTKREIEAAALHLFTKDYALAAGPFKKIDAEYRVVMLDGEAKLIFRKDRPTLIGDGEKTVRELCIAQLMTSPAGLDLLLSDSFTIKLDLLDQVPSAGEIVPILWKHNLGSGARASVNIDPEIKSSVQALAIKAAKSIGVRFASIDIVKTDGELMIMEINSGVMMEKAPAFIPGGREIAKEIYKEAICKMFSIRPSPTRARTMEHDDSSLTK